MVRLRALVVLAAAALATAGEVPQELLRDFQKLVDWVQAGINGAGLGDTAPPLQETLELTTGEFGNSLTAKQQIERGATIAMLPTSRLVHDKYFDPALDYLDPHIQAAIFVARQKKLGETSDWAPWLRVLPKEHDLPKYWDKELMEETMKGSRFPRFVRSDQQETASDWAKVQSATGLSWEEYEWGHNAVATRSIFWNGSWVGGRVTGKTGRFKVGLFPLFDLMCHGLPANVKYDFDIEKQALRMYALDTIPKGGLLFLAYFEPRSKSNWEILRIWGFASDHASRMAEVTLVDSEEAGDDQTFALETDARSGAGRAFLARLRANVTGNQAIRMLDNLPRPVPQGYLAVPDVKSGWIYYYNLAAEKSSWFHPEDPEGKMGPTYTPATTWGVEKEALRRGKEIFNRSLARYPQTLREDQDLLDGGAVEDHRLRAMITVRRDEKSVLAWWLFLIDQALANAPADDDAPVARSQDYLDPLPLTHNSEL